MNYQEKEIKNRLRELVSTGTMELCKVEQIPTQKKAKYQCKEYILYCHNCYIEFGYVLYGDGGEANMDELLNFCPNCDKPVKLSDKKNK